MEIIASVPKEGFYTLFIEGSFIEMVELPEEYEIVLNKNNIIFLFYHFPYHRRVYITCDPKLMNNSFVHKFKDLDQPRSVLAQLRGRNFDKIKAAVVYLKKLTKDACFHYPVSFWTQLIWIVQQGKNSRENLFLLVIQYDNEITREMQKGIKWKE